MKKSHIILTLPLMLLVLSCGGGGGDDGGDDGGGSGRTPATMNQTSARQAMGVLQFGSIMSALYNDTGVRFMAGPGSDRTAFAESMMAAVLRMTEQNILNPKQRDASGSFNRNCSYEGSISVSGSWTGPDAPRDCSDIADLKATVTMDSCAAENTTSMNGQATIALTGSSCAPSAVSIGFNTMNFTNTDEQVSIQIDNLDITLTDITWDNSQSFITHGRMVVNGDASGTVEGVQFQDRFDQLTEIMTTTDNVNFSVQYSGWISGDCFDGWVAIETLEPIEFNAYDNCPTAGQLSMAGNINMLVTINEDGTITADGETYQDCNDFVMSCAP